MRNFIFFMALAIGVISLRAQEADTSIRFEELPYSEGMLYVSVENDGRPILMKAIEIEGDQVCIGVNLKDCIGEELSIRAFQDLNDNGKLDFDSFGRPSEPCLQDKFVPKADTRSYTFALIEY